MKIFKYIIVLLLTNVCCFLFSLESKAQEIKVIKFDELKQMIQSNDGVQVFNFWATWCKPCVAEIPHFETIAKEFRQNGVKVALVSLDFKKDIQNLETFVRENRLECTIYLLDEPDYNAWINQINTQWSGALPATLIVSGLRNEFFEKTFDYQSLVEKVKQFL